MVASLYEIFSRSDIPESYAYTLRAMRHMLEETAKGRDTQAIADELVKVEIGDIILIDLRRQGCDGDDTEPGPPAA